MLKVQEYLSEHGLDRLKDELHINVTEDEAGELCILNYDQIESPRSHPVCRECRGLVLAKKDFSLVARSFPRFFNWGEMKDEQENFDWGDFTCQSKEDGSLITLHLWKGQWRANTRGSFGLGKMGNGMPTWQEVIWPLVNTEELDQSLTYVCELVSPYNKVVRRYVEPELYLLTAFCREEELPITSLPALAGDAGLSLPKTYPFKSYEEISSFLGEKEAEDPTFEGVVIRDKSNNRWKVKSKSYLGLHRLSANGSICSLPNLLPFIMSGEEKEVLSYFPEVEKPFREYKAAIDGEYAQLRDLWRATKDIKEQKEFALAIVPKTKFASVLFNLRKSVPMNQSEADLKRAWRQAESTILKVFSK